LLFTKLTGRGFLLTSLRAASHHQQNTKMRTARILTIRDDNGSEYTTQREDYRLSEAIAGAMEHYPSDMGQVVNIAVQLVTLDQIVIES
jgi:hypothetical protein